MTGRAWFGILSFVRGFTCPGVFFSAIYRVRVRVRVRVNRVSRVSRVGRVSRV